MSNKLTFAEALAPMDGPHAPVRDMILVKLGEVFSLVQENNKRVASINASKATDPNNVEYLDKRREEVINDPGTDDVVLTQDEKRYQKLIGEAEKLLTKMRDHVKENHLLPTLSEKEVQDLKKSVNDGKAVIAEAVIGAKSFAEIADMQLTLLGKAVEGGVMSLMPTPDSLMNSRPRKSTTANAASGEGYATRVSEITVDGISTNKTVTRNGVGVVKAHFNFVAETLSRKFNGSTDGPFPGNAVTMTEIEEAYYASHTVNGNAIEFRDAAKMPTVHSFKFTKEIEVQMPNDDSTKREPHTVVIEVTKWVKENDTETPAAPATQESDASATEAK